MEIRYYQKDGRIGVKYILGSKEMDQVHAEDLIRPYPAKDPWFDENDLGLVPDEVVAQGRQAIQTYARQVCGEHHERNLAKERQHRESVAKRKNDVNRVITAHCGGTDLKGRIIKNPHGYGVFVTLEEPFASSKGFIFDYPNSFASSMGGWHVYDHNGELTKKVLSDAQDAIITLYKEGTEKRKYGKVVKLVEALNGKEEE